MNAQPRWTPMMMPYSADLTSFLIVLSVWCDPSVGVEYLPCVSCNYTILDRQSSARGFRVPSQPRGSHRPAKAQPGLMMHPPRHHETSGTAPPKGRSHLSFPLFASLSTPSSTNKRSRLHLLCSEPPRWPAAALVDDSFGACASGFLGSPYFTCHGLKNAMGIRLFFSLL